MGHKKSGSVGHWRNWVASWSGAMVLGLLSWSGAAWGAERGGISGRADGEWRSLFNGKDLTGWETWLGPASGGYHDPGKSAEKPVGLNRDPKRVFTVVEKDGGRAIRISGEVFGAISTLEAFTNVHIRVEYKWGSKKWPPRHEARHYRDSGILYWCVGEHGAGSMAWKRSVECNIMEKGVGQWWSVAGSYCDIQGRRVVLERELGIPYRGEGPGEQCILWDPSQPRMTTMEGITSLLDPERPGGWNTCEVVAWGHVGLHVLNGQVVLALAHPRYKEKDREIRLDRGQIQLQSEAAELFYRKVEVRPITSVPADWLGSVPREPAGEEGFERLWADDGAPGWAQCGPGRFRVANGVAEGEGGMGLWWYTNRMYRNFVLRGEWLQAGAHSDSGVFFRFPNPGGDPWVAVRQGHEFEIGEAAAENGWDGTGSFYPYQGPAQLELKPVGEWNAYELVCVGPNYALWINGRLVNTWTDTTGRPLAGYIGLQNYPYPQAVRHRNVRIKELL